VACGFANRSVEMMREIIIQISDIRGVAETLRAIKLSLRFESRNNRLLDRSISGQVYLSCSLCAGELISAMEIYG